MKIFLNQFLLLFAGYVLAVVVIEGLPRGSGGNLLRSLLLALLVPLLQSLVLFLVTRRNQDNSR